MSRYDEVFSPFEIKGLTLPNRVVCPPLVQKREIGSAGHVAWCRRLAAGGAGTVILEAVGVPHFGSEWTADTFRSAVDAIHGEGAAAGIQLFPIPFGTDADVNSVGAGDIDEIVAQYAVAARVCRDAGFDAVEPHGAHGYLINRFFMPDVNKRTDEYGGSVENRGRFARRIVERIKAETGDKLLIFYRHTPAGEAYGMEDSLQLAESLVEAGADVLDISPAMGERVAGLAAPFAEAFDVAVIAVGGMEDPAAAAEALRDGRCDLVAVGRQLICDAEWPDKIRRGKEDEVLWCNKCNKCFDDLAAGRPVGCALWKNDPVAEFVQ